VVALFKKGDDALPENYRPISLLCIGYKVLAGILLDRLKQGGADGRIRESQYGFRPKRGTADALFLARRVIDATLASSNGSVLLLLLDWSKAFDRVKPEALLRALDRFGLSEGILAMIGAIYESRTFSIRDGGGRSAVHKQAAGIAQGCPLSPYLFVMAMTVLLDEVDANLVEQGMRPAPGQDAPYIVTRDILYADDTLLVATHSHALQKHLDAVIQAGRGYGLEINFGKTFLLSVNSDAVVYAPDGAPIKRVEQAVYLGGLLAADGRPKAEITRRLGEAKRTVDNLQAVWQHANMTREWKKTVLDACVIQKLLYGLESLCVLQADRARLDSFYARCLRRIYRIPSAYVSRISNAEVYAKASAERLSSMLDQRQLVLYGRIASMGSESLVRQIALSSDGIGPKTWNLKRKRGRPRLQWATVVHAGAIQVATAAGTPLENLLGPGVCTQAWREAVRRHY